MSETGKLDLPDLKDLNYFSADSIDYRGWQNGRSPKDMVLLLEELSDNLPRRFSDIKRLEDYFLGLSELSAIAAIAYKKGEVQAFNAVCALASPVSMANHYATPVTAPLKEYTNRIIRLCTHFVDACASTVRTLPERDSCLDEQNQSNASIHNLPEIVQDLSCLSLKFNGTVFESPHIRVTLIENAPDAVLFKPDDGPETLVLGDVVVAYADVLQAVQGFGGPKPGAPA